MMGRRIQDQGQLFYSFNLDAAVPGDHLVRQIARVLDLSWVHNELEPHYSRIGRPSIDPVLMIRMLVVGYVFAIRSERALCREIHVNLAYRWFCGLSIEDNIPDHSAFSRARNERFRDGDIFRQVFERVVSACIDADLVGGQGFAVDASLIAADANKCRSTPGGEWNKEIDPGAASRAIKDYLATLDDPAFGAASEVVPKFVSPSDPAAQWTGALRNAAFFAYADNYLIDVKFGIIMDVEASRAIRQAEVGASRTMLDRTERCFGIKPDWLAADTAYGAAPNLHWLVDEKQIAPHVPVIDKEKHKEGIFSREDFIYDEACDVYICPAQNQLPTTGRVHADGLIRYLAPLAVCRACSMRPQCCPGVEARRILRRLTSSTACRSPTQMLVLSAGEQDCNRGDRNMPSKTPLLASQRVVQICLFLVTAIALPGGALQMYLGEPQSGARLDNVHRFMAGIYFGSGLIALWAGATVRQQGTLVYLIAFSVLLAGAGRLTSISLVGVPEPMALWLGYLVPELIVPFVMSAAHAISKRSSSSVQL